VEVTKRRFCMPLLFVDNTAAHDPPTIEEPPSSKGFLNCLGEEMPRVFIKGTGQPPFYPANNSAHARYGQIPGVAGNLAFQRLTRPERP
jgi:hypothetical protein